MFGIDAADLVLILVLAVVLFGPERLPEYSRKLARIFVYLRGIANNAKGTLREELGPEYADLELKDLHPKALVAKHMRDEIAPIEETQRELREAAESLKLASKEVEGATKSSMTDAKTALKQDELPSPAAEEELALAAPSHSPYDPEAT